MPGSITAQWVIPIVAAAALFGWLGAVLYAQAHPRYKTRQNLPKNEVSGGAFEAVDGGRQLMPTYGASPLSDEELNAILEQTGGVPGPRAEGQGQPAEQPPGQRAEQPPGQAVPSQHARGASAEPVGEHQPAAERHPVPGRKPR